MITMTLEHIPESEKIVFKEKFIERYSKLTDWEAFKQCSLSFLRKSIRVNTLKISILELVKRMSKQWILEPIPWCREGFWITHKEGRKDIGNTIEHDLGYIYVQEGASMIPPVVLDIKPGQSVLDLCAAPGSKSSQIASYLENTGILVSNDITGVRLASLGINMQRVGAANVVITQMQGYAVRGQQFDRILVDAPCSGTGTIRKSLKTIDMWNPLMVKKLSAVQKGLLKKAWQNLKPEGILVYSTCSLEPEENEGVVDDFLKKNPDARLEKIDLNIKKGKIITEFEGQIYSREVEKCLRLWPQDNDTEGFFVAKLVKL